MCLSTVFPQFQKSAHPFGLLGVGDSLFLMLPFLLGVLGQLWWWSGYSCFCVQEWSMAELWGPSVVLGILTGLCRKQNKPLTYCTISPVLLIVFSSLWSSPSAGACLEENEYTLVIPIIIKYLTTGLLLPFEGLSSTNRAVWHWQGGLSYIKKLSFSFCLIRPV